MRRIYATFDDAADASDAKTALRDADIEPDDPDIDNPFFDPTITIPEARGWLWGGLIGGVIGVVLLVALDQNVFWIPRISPIMTAGPWALGFLGFGLGVASGGFLGGVVGTYRELPDADRPQIVVTVPDHRVEEVTDRLRSTGATAVDATVTHHEHPHRTRVTDTST